MERPGRRSPQDEGDLEPLFPSRIPGLQQASREGIPGLQQGTTPPTVEPPPKKPPQAALPWGRSHQCCYQLGG